MRNEREKMLAGELYDPLDPELTADRVRARDLCQALNATREADEGDRRRILIDLFGGGRRRGLDAAPVLLRLRVEHLPRQARLLQLQLRRPRRLPRGIGDFTLFGPAVQIYTATHPLEAELRRSREFGKPVTIGSDVWVGGAAIILPGVTIGSRCVIGAGSVVTRDIPDDVFAAGNPCRVIRKLTQQIE